MSLQIWVPHGKKVAVKDLPAGADPTNPPLTEQAKQDAEKLTDELVRLYGPPGIIFTSPKIRCLQTAAPAIERFGQHEKGGVLVVTLNTLCQPENGDHDPTNPNARPDGLVIYGKESFSPDWWNWFLLSVDVINVLIDALGIERTVWVFTHRPIVGAAHWGAKNNGDEARPSKDSIDAGDKALLPFCIFKRTGNQGWQELPRT